MARYAVFVFLIGVFGVDADEVMSVSVMEGQSVTLHTDLTEIEKDDLILWQFVPQGTLVAEMCNLTIIKNGKRVELDSQTGSLTITNITVTDAGIYKVQIISNGKMMYKKFNISVAPLPTPPPTPSSEPQPVLDRNRILIVFSVIGAVGIGVAIVTVLLWKKKLTSQRGASGSQDLSSTGANGSQDEANNGFAA